ncbi:alpha/beta fold hydrolase [Sphingomonas sp. RB1R13]|uniref:alpha/beta fold hydrolase n=1 Tax=Sphingomonas sp. RB1R13 TaxID=3096159 RepID=UPI002FCAA740
MSDRLLLILSREWLAVAVGAVLACAGLSLFARHSSAFALGILVALLGFLLIVGGCIHLLRLGRARLRHPPPGTLVKLGKARVHVYAEGQEDGTYPVVWFGGAHSAGLTMDHLHRALRGKTRSILVDRLGTGWSDTGSFPRRTEQEADEIPNALREAGEAGPFVLVGYSFGGLLAANIARRHPELVAVLILLDATPLETIVFGPRLEALRAMRRDALLSGLLRLVGIPADLSRKRSQAAGHSAATERFERALGPALDTLRAVEVSAGSQFANYSSYQDLAGPTIADRGWETMVYDGDLGDMPVWLVAPGNASEVIAEKEVAGAGKEQERMVRFFARSRERYLAISSNARRIMTPFGTTHQFVYETPEFVIGVVEEAIRHGQNNREK